MKLNGAIVITGNIKQSAAGYINKECGGDIKLYEKQLNNNIADDIRALFNTKEFENLDIQVSVELTEEKEV